MRARSIISVPVLPLAPITNSLIPIRPDSRASCDREARLAASVSSAVFVQHAVGCYGSKFLRRAGEFTRSYFAPVIVSEFVTPIWLLTSNLCSRRSNEWLSLEQKKESISFCKAGRGSHPNRIVLEAQNTAWGDEKSATYMATA